MAYRVSLTRRARRDYFQIHEFTNAPASEPARLWFLGLDRTISLLATAPRMGTVTSEDSTVRQVTYGNKPHIYRILYDLDDMNQIVNILSIWHGKRLPPTL